MRVSRRPLALSLEVSRSSPVGFAGGNIALAPFFSQPGPSALGFGEDGDGSGGGSRGSGKRLGADPQRLCWLTFGFCSDAHG